MPPPFPQIASKDGCVKNGAPLAPPPSVFPANTIPFPPVSGAAPAGMVFTNVMQLPMVPQQPQQPNQPHYSLSANGGAQTANPNQQFFMTTTTTTQATTTQPGGQAVPQIQTSMQQGQAPIMVSDPNVFLQALHMNMQVLSQQQNAQMQFKVPQVQPSDPKVPSVPDQAFSQSKECANIIQQALQNPKFAAAGQILLKAMQSQASPLYMNGQVQEKSVSPHNVLSAETPKTDLVVSDVSSKPTQQVSFKEVEAPPKIVYSSAAFVPKQEGFFNQAGSAATVVSQETPSSVPSVPSQDKLFLGSTLEPVKRQESGDVLSGEEDMWKAFFDSSEWDGLDDKMASLASSIPPPAAAPVVQVQMPVEPQTGPTVAVPDPFAQSLVPTPQAPPRVDKVIPARAECGKVKKHQPPQRPPVKFEFKGSPQQYLMAILKERGYSTDHIPNAKSGYQSGGTPLQLASFGTEVVKSINKSDLSKLTSLLDCGLSPSPCNTFGDFMVHLVCKRANADILECLVAHGCDLNICDSFGRTPLHCVAWAGDFCERAAVLLLDANSSQMLVEDNRGKCPLEYVRKEDWPEWIDFLRSHMDTYWPIGGAAGQARIPPVKHEEEETGASLDLVADVANGAISPEAYARMDESTRKEYKKEDSTLQETWF